jgi:hypothetical protein
MPIFHVAYDGAEANVHASNLPSAKAQLEYVVDNDIAVGEKWGVAFTFDHLPPEDEVVDDEHQVTVAYA